MIVRASATPKLKYMLNYRVLNSWTGRKCQEGLLHARSFWLKNILIWMHLKPSAKFSPLRLFVLLQRMLERRFVEPRAVALGARHHLDSRLGFGDQELFA